HGGPDPGGAALLQWQRARLSREMRVVPFEPRRRAVRLRARGVFQRRAERRQRTERGFPMRAVLQNGFGGADVRYVGEAEAPEAAPGRVLIRVAAASVNRPDIVQREGNYPPPPGESPILGLDAAGTIEAVGDGVTGFAPGDRVVALLPGGGYAELAAAPAGQVLHLPENLSFAAGACIPETYITAYMNLFMNARLADGETVLLHGGGGGVTTAAIQLCRTLVPAAHVLVTASPG